MEQLESILSAYPPEYQIYVLGGIIFLTSLGLFPGNTDLFMIGTAALAASHDQISFWSAYIVVATSLCVGENIVFLGGKKIGQKIIHKFKPDFYDQPVVHKLTDKIQHSPLKALISIRLTPFGRPIFYLSMANLGLRRQDFYKFHAGIVYTYVLILMFFGQELVALAKKLFA